jgi:hypothetical protein
MSPSWTDREPGLREAAQELRWMGRRARRRWPTILGLSVAVAAGLTLMQARSPRRFTSRMTLRVLETDFDPQTTPPTSDQLTQYLRDVALSRRALLDTIVQYDLYPDEYRLDPSLALERMREDVEIEIGSNYFALERQPDAPVRSARLAIAYTGRDPEVSLRVVQHLSQLAEAGQRQSRQAAARAQAAAAERRVDRARHDLLWARTELAKTESDLAHTADPVQRSLLFLTQRRMQNEVDQTQEQVRGFDAIADRWRLRSDFESQASGIRFEIVDPGRPARLRWSDSQRLLLTAVLGWLVGLPVLAMGIVAFDPRVWDARTVRRLGLEPIGHVPAFPGSTLGVWRGRPGPEVE